MGLKSMTGFGRSELKSAEGLIRVEIKTVNQKFFEFSSRLPGHLAEFEEAIRKQVAQEVRRGKVNFFLAAPDPSAFSAKLFLNAPLAKEVAHQVRKLKTVLNVGSLGSDEHFVLREVLRYPEVLTKDASSKKKGEFSAKLSQAVATALLSLRKSREREGGALQKDFRNRIGEIEKALRGVEKRIPALARQYRTGLESRMKDFLKNGDLDRERLTLEVAQYLKNSDVSEEVTRMKSHLDAMRKALSERGELGRKLDFIAQEMTRESNTMGAKSSDVTIANHVIQIKSAIEKIREQAQNVE
jgi:uncharacterized protein (TIGR00255 family)